MPCPVCGYHTFEVLGAWDTCSVCGWNSDPVQETMPDDPTGGNGISLNEARGNYEMLGAISEAKLSEVDPNGTKKYPRSEQFRT
ncbi:MAG: hydrolase [Anaerolineae bacterium]|nr:hydrolase [Anaerolineae bacterium]